MRDVVLEAAARRPGARIEIAPLGVDDLLAADECFLTNSLIGIWPIHSVHGTRLGVGPLVHELQATLIEQGAITRD